MRGCCVGSFEYNNADKLEMTNDMSLCCEFVYYLGDSESNSLE